MLGRCHRGAAGLRRGAAQDHGSEDAGDARSLVVEHPHPLDAQHPADPDPLKIESMCLALPKVTPMPDRVKVAAMMTS